MQRRSIDIVAVALLAAAIVLALLEYRLALQARYVMDEFLQMSLGGDMYRGARPYVDVVPFKTQLGYLPFAALHGLFARAESLLFAGRQVGFLFSLLSLCAVFAIQRRLAGGTRRALWAVVWVLACSTFERQSTPV